MLVVKGLGRVLESGVSVGCGYVWIMGSRVQGVNLQPKVGVSYRYHQAL